MAAIPGKVASLLRRAEAAGLVVAEVPTLATRAWVVRIPDARPHHDQLFVYWMDGARGGRINIYGCNPLAKVNTRTVKLTRAEAIAWLETMSAKGTEHV